MECTFCKKSFSTKPNLVNHQKTAKYCLKIRGETNIVFTCNDCDKCFTTQQTLNEHILYTCKQHHKNLYEKQIEILRQEKETILREHELKLQEKDAYISKLEARIEKMDETINIALGKNKETITHHTTNNTTNHTVVHNYLNLSNEHVKKILEELDHNVVYAGQEGLAKFVVENMLKDKDGNIIYICVDPSRQVFEFINERGEKVRDFKSEKLIQTLIKNDVIKQGLEVAAKGWSTNDEKLNLSRSTVFAPKVLEYTNFNRENSVFRTKVSALTVK
jgi:hypothetical protein